MRTFWPLRHFSVWYTVTTDVLLKHDAIYLIAHDNLNFFFLHSNVLEAIEIQEMILKEERIGQTLKHAMRKRIDLILQYYHVEISSGKDIWVFVMSSLCFIFCNNLNSISSSCGLKLNIAVTLKY